MVFAPDIASAQEDPTQQQIDKLSGQIQDMQATLGDQDKRIAALEKKINDLTDKLNSSGSSGVASADDLKKLADVVQEVDKKRQSDNEAILKELEKLDKALALLNPDEREILVLSRYQGLKYEEISKIKDISVAAIKVQVHRAMKHLRVLYFKQ